MTLRREELLRHGADEVVEIPFDLELSKKNPEQFVREVLVGDVGAGVVVVGENFRYGHRAAGDVGDLHRLMLEMVLHLPGVLVSGEGYEAVCNGRRIARCGIAGSYRVMCGEELLAVYRDEGDEGRAEVVLCAG